MGTTNTERQRQYRERRRQSGRLAVEKRIPLNGRYVTLGPVIDPEDFAHPESDVRKGP